MTLDALAYFIGYAIIYSGSVLLSAFLIGLGAWLVVEWYWRRHGDMKVLREFFIWKRDRQHPPVG